MNVKQELLRTDVQKGKNIKEQKQQQRYIENEFSSDIRKKERKKIIKN